MVISKKLVFIALIGVITNLCIASQDNIAVALEVTPKCNKTAKFPELDKTQDETVARKIIEDYTSELFAQTPPNKKNLKIALWLDKKIKADVNWEVEFVPGNYNPETKEFIALAHVITHYPNHSLKILQALRANEKAEIANLDVKHSFIKEEHSESLNIIIAVGYSSQPQWLKNDLFKTFLVPFEKSKDRKFICSKDLYEKKQALH